MLFPASCDAGESIGARCRSGDCGVAVRERASCSTATKCLPEGLRKRLEGAGRKPRARSRRVIAVVPRTCSRCWPTDPFARCRRRLRSDTVRLSHGVVRPVSVPTGCQRDEERMSGWRRGIHSAPRGASFIPSAQNLSGRGPARATLPLLSVPARSSARATLPLPAGRPRPRAARRCRVLAPRSGGGGVRTKVRITSINASSR